MQQNTVWWMVWLQPNPLDTQLNIFNHEFKDNSKAVRFFSFLPVVIVCRQLKTLAV